MNAPTRQQKSKVIQTVVDVLYEVGARFLKRVKGAKYMKLDERYFRQKVQHALRDLAAFKASSEETNDSSPSPSSDSNSTKSSKENPSISTRDKARDGELSDDDDAEFSMMEHIPLERMLISASNVVPQVINTWNTVEVGLVKGQTEPSKEELDHLDELIGIWSASDESLAPLPAVYVDSIT
jgi:hypothetical protein